MIIFFEKPYFFKYRGAVWKKWLYSLTILGYTKLFSGTSLSIDGRLGSGQLVWNHFWRNLKRTAFLSHVTWEKFRNLFTIIINKISRLCSSIKKNIIWSRDGQKIHVFRKIAIFSLSPSNFHFKNNGIKFFFSSRTESWGSIYSYCKIILEICHGHVILYWGKVWKFSNFQMALRSHVTNKNFFFMVKIFWTPVQLWENASGTNF